MVVAGWAALLLQLSKGRRAVLLRGVRWQKKGRRAVGIRDAERGPGSAGLPGSAVGSARAAGVVWGSWLRRAACRSAGQGRRPLGWRRAGVARQLAARAGDGWRVGGKEWMGLGRWGLGCLGLM